mmetsp:Transcript_39698/g.71286  ORF Transcript_39698/g.71286 Transcript_39698/m.71286 type:complete len:118 (-) Transcript_39698:106-459(-)
MVRDSLDMVHRAPTGGGILNLMVGRHLLFDIQTSKDTLSCLMLLRHAMSHWIKKQLHRIFADLNGTKASWDHAEGISDAAGFPYKDRNVVLRNEDALMKSTVDIFLSQWCQDHGVSF